MSIDWFTFGAQLLNFLVLVWLLRRFLYRPVAAAVDRREEGIRRRREEAEEERARAEALVGRCREELAELEAAREDRLREAEREAARLGRELEEEVREEAERSRRRWERSVQRQRDSLLAELRDRVAAHAVSTSRELLRRLADRELEGEVARALARRLGDLGPEATGELADAVRRAGGEARVVSRFELDEPDRDRLRGALRELIGEEVELVFEISPDAILGIELRAGDRKVGWSAGDRLDAAEREVAELLEAGEPPRGPGEAEVPGSVPGSGPGADG